jgi:pyruvate/2-oxoglutarate dehydrogenase complex dihydrolipoamide dehydrogenase (E3) component
MPGPVVVLGGGAAGEAFCGALRRIDADRKVMLVESKLVGGECSYFACMPSKTLLRAPELLAAMRLAPGLEEAELDPARVFWWRDQVVDGRDDSGHAEWLADRDVELVRGAARVVAPGRLDVDGRQLAYDALVVSTGSSPAVPPLPGLEDVESWGTAEATSASATPASLVVLGGGAAGCELAQLYRRLGSEVTVVQRGPRLLPRIDERAAALVARVFEEEGILLRVGATVERVLAGRDGIRLVLAGGEELEAERLLVSTGRRPNVEGVGLEAVGVRVSDRGVEVDERLAAAPGVWAIGDVTGVALFTHVGKYQGRVAAANVAGRDRRADYRAIPAVAFTDPQVAQVGRVEGDGLVAAEWRVDRTSRSSTYERPKREGFVRLVADPGRRVLVGGVAVGPEAGEWLQQITLAIRAEVPVDVLRDTIQPFPTFSEAISFAARDLPL